LGFNAQLPVGRFLKCCLKLFANSPQGLFLDFNARRGRLPLVFDNKNETSCNRADEQKGYEKRYNSGNATTLTPEKIHTFPQNVEA